MKRIVYSPDYKEKLTVIRNWLDLRFGKDNRTKHMTEIKKRLTSLKEFSGQGMSVRDMFGVDSDYEFLYVSHNYIFYYQDAETIYIVNIYDEREDFMYKLFGIRTTSEETDQYWRE
ncbi:MAG: type II toxin-antitoxin system RelE/ParE family toxin [Oscillospiraceae bacterium]|nr:type II toxin-antitoxin system RelE/ParE family toxin [Oscillospiraceae bacterium]